jgi:hypothetical protein
MMGTNGQTNVEQRRRRFQECPNRGQLQPIRAPGAHVRPQMRSFPGGCEGGLARSGHSKWRSNKTESPKYPLRCCSQRTRGRIIRHVINFLEFRLYSKITVLFVPCLAWGFFS